MKDEAYLVANELDINRNKALVENVNRWGNVNCTVSNGRSGVFTGLEGQFDLVLLDAPCSGEGMFRKDRQSLEQWSPNLVRSCATIQSELIDDAAALVSPGGYLVYSTCTFEPEENERQIERIMKSHDFEGVSIDLDAAWNIQERSIKSGPESVQSYYLYFHNVMGEGQFVCVLKKRGDEAERRRFKVKKRYLRRLKADEEQRVNDFISIPAGYSLVEYKSILYAVPSDRLDLQEWLLDNMPLWKMGVKLGQFAGKDFKPHHELALSNISDAFSRKIELSYDEAISYLKREVLSLPPEAEKGWSLMTYKGLALGWGKNLGNRFNNYYPKELALRKEIKKAE